MIDSKLIKQLDSPDVETRKKAVKALAQTKDPDALKYLATIYKTDGDPEVRDLALKAGKYIRKFSEGTASGGRAAAFSTPTDEEEDDVYPAADDRLAALRPEEIEVSEADQDRAHSYVQAAMNLHMHGDNARAFQSLTKAFEANPKLKHDSYTTGLATTITGRSLDATLEMLEPSIERGTMRSTGHVGGEGPVRSGAHMRVAFLLLVGVAILFSGYLAMPWFDVGGLEISDPTSGQPTTMNDALQQVKDGINASIDAAGANAGLSADDVAKIKDAINGLKLNLTGLEVAMVGTGLSNVLDVIGLTNLLDVTGQTATTCTQDTPPAILDYTLLLLPAVAVLLLVLALILVVGSSASTTLWLLTMVLSLGALVPMLYFFAESLRFIVADNSSCLSDIGSVANLPANGTAFIAVGFWVSMIGLVIIILSPILAFLLPNPVAKEKAKAA